MSSRTARTFCRICQAQCGLVVELDGERIIRVTGDPDHPLSRGYTCSKGRAIGEMHHSPLRLDGPLLRGRPASWDEVMHDLGSRLAEILRDHGPESIACYRSTGWVFDTNGRSIADRWMRAVGTRQLYSPATIDTPNRMLVPDLMMAAPFIQPVVDWAETEVLILLGQNLVVSHGHATSVSDPVRRLREIRARGGSVIVADPRATETARLADLHLQLRPGTDAALAAYMVGVRLESRPDAAYLDAFADPQSVQRLREAVAPFDRDTTARLCDVEPHDLDRLASMLCAVARVSAATGTGVSMGPTGNVTEWLSWALAAVTGSLDRRGGMLINPGVIRPQSETGPTRISRVTGPPPETHPELEHAYGEYPSAILCDEILAGNVRALVSFGGNVLASFPDTAKTRAALESLEVLAVTELRHTQTTEVATHVLATTDQVERADVTFFIDQMFPVPFAQYTPALVEPIGERRSLVSVMLHLAREMGLTLSDKHAAGDEDILRNIMKRSRVTLDELRSFPSGVVVDAVALAEWFVPEHLPGGRMDVAPSVLVDQLRGWTRLATDGGCEAPGELVLICRRLPHQLNSDLHDIASQRRPPAPTLLMNPGDAGCRGVTDGEIVTVQSPSGRTSAVLEVTDRIRPGAVSLPHAWREPAVNNLTTADELDPLTGMPRYTALPVTVSRG